MFDGLSPEFKFAAVDANGWAFAYEQRPRPCVKIMNGFSFSGMFRAISGDFDATDWQNSLIERKEIAAAKKPPHWFDPQKDQATESTNEDEK